MATTAAIEGDKVTINGSKVAVLNGTHADKLLVVARTSGDQLDREGISVFLVDNGAAGVSRQSYTNVDGHGAAVIRFDGVTA